MIDMSMEEFGDLVDQAVAGIPQEFRKLMENVEIIVEDWPTEDDLGSSRAHPHTTLFGLYRGVPKTKRGNYYAGVLPDKITIFAGPILSHVVDKKEAKYQIKKTVIHEIGHHFGMSEEAIRKGEGIYSGGHG